MAFHLGSLGFLTPFKFDTYQSQVTQIIEGTEEKLPDLFFPLFQFAKPIASSCLCEQKETHVY